MNLRRRCAAEAVGTALLLASIVGSGIMAERLAQGNAAVALLANAIATGGGLVALILMFGPVSGAQFNPAVTLSLAFAGRLRRHEVPVYLVAQISGAIVGVCAAHLMFGQELMQVATQARPGLALFWSELVASFGLVMLIFACLRHRPTAIPFAVAAYIVAACWFTASTSFANPAVTLARALSDTFAGIRPIDVPAFLAAQLLGAAAAVAFDGWLYRSEPVAVESPATSPSPASP